jgi:hypothetical protein
VGEFQKRREDNLDKKENYMKKQRIPIQERRGDSFDMKEK